MANNQENLQNYVKELTVLQDLIDMAGAIGNPYEKLCVGGLLNDRAIQIKSGISLCEQINS